MGLLSLLIDLLFVAFKKCHACIHSWVSGRRLYTSELHWLCKWNWSLYTIFILANQKQPETCMTWQLHGLDDLVYASNPFNCNGNNALAKSAKLQAQSWTVKNTLLDTLHQKILPLSWSCEMDITLHIPSRSALRPCSFQKENRSKQRFRSSKAST